MNIITNKWILPGVKCWFDVSKLSPETCYSQVEILSVDTSKKFLIKLLSDNKTIEADSQSLLEKNEENGLAQGFEDLVQMSVLNEPEILYNLSIRFRQDIIFTSIGPTLLVINPYKEIPHIFNEETMKSFRKKNEMPHIYSVAFLAYTQLIENSKNQAIVISGESGAGKTETTKHAMKFLTTSAFGSKISNEETPIEEKILRCNPILEAFGNSKTIRNDNSSRFGKFVRLLINKNSKGINGATITSYLLEKSRLTAPSKGERNFHIFYHLLKGCDIKELAAFNLIDAVTKKTYKPEYFEYLKKSQCYDVPKINDKELFYEVLASFNKTNFTNLEIKGIFRLLASILHLGNLFFDAENLTDTKPCTLKAGDLGAISQMLSVPENALLKALVFKTREIQGTIIESPQPLSECISMRDSLSKFLYEKLFNWLVKRLNLVIFPPEEISNLRKVRKSIKLIRESLTQTDCATSSIGLLDIFGFENFETNSFEQLCINFTNEKLQQLYVSYVFKSEEKELIDQGLQGFLGQLAYQDNQGIIDLLDKYPSGVYDLLDESSSLGSGTDEFLLQKIAKTHGKNTHFAMPKNKVSCFTIIHTAKAVEYDIRGFRAKNKDEISSSLQMMLQASKDELLGQMIQNMVIKENVEKKKMGSVGISKADKFLGAKFRTQMKELMTELFFCEVHFIRCIKPNEAKKESFFMADFVLLQIRYLGILDSIRIRKQGFALRQNYEDFGRKYSGVLGFYGKKNSKEVVCSFFEKNKQYSNEIGKKILFGSSKIYMKQDVMDFLDEKLLEIWKIKVSVGKRVRKLYKTYVFKNKVKKGLKNIRRIFISICKIQAMFKAKKMRAKYLKKKLGAIKINKKVKMLCLSKFFEAFRKKMRAVKKMNCFIKAFNKLVILKPLKSSIKHCFLLINSVKKKKIPEIPMSDPTKSLNGQQPEINNKKLNNSLEKLVEKTNEKINEKNIEKLKEKTKEKTNEKTNTEKTKNEKTNIEKTSNEKTNNEKIYNEKTNEKINEKTNEKLGEQLKEKTNEEKLFEKTDNSLGKIDSNNAHEEISPQQEGKVQFLNQSEPKKPQLSYSKTSNLKKSSFLKEEEKSKSPNPSKFKSDEKTVRISSNFSEIGAPPLHIGLTDFRTETEKCTTLGIKMIDPCEFDGNFIDLSSYLHQETYSPLHHYTIYGSNEEPESLSFSIIPVSHDCFNDLSDLDSGFLKFLNETDWKNGMEKLINSKLLKARAGFDQIMTHSKKKIKSSIQNLSSKHNESALLIFKYILQFSLERKTKFSLSIQLKKLLKILMQAHEIELIDEFYLQITKQLILCPNPKTVQKIMTLLGIVSSIIAITPRMFMPFLAFLYGKIMSEYSQDEELLHQSRFCFLRVKNLFEVGSRKELPLDNELFLIENCKKIMVPINFLLGNHIFIYVESYTTIKEAVTLALYKLALESKMHYFGLYQVKRKEDPIQYEEMFLEDSVKIMDVLTSWELEPKQKSSEMKLYIRQKVFYKFPCDDLDSVEMIYSHFVYEVLRGRLEFDEATALKLGALSLTVDHGDFSKEKARFLKINIQRYIPEHLLGLNPPQVWIDKIIMDYLKIKSYDRTNAKLIYLDLIKGNPFFLTEQFTIKYTVVNLELKGSQIEKKEREMNFAVKPNAMSFYGINKMECEKNYQIKDIKSWGINETGMILIETHDSIKHLIKSERCYEIDYLIKKYIDFNN